MPTLVKRKTPPPGHPDTLSKEKMTSGENQRRDQERPLPHSESHKLWRDEKPPRISHTHRRLLEETKYQFPLTNNTPVILPLVITYLLYLDHGHPQNDHPPT
jgi:hypothetical protein